MSCVCVRACERACMCAWDCLGDTRVDLPRERRRIERLRAARPQDERRYEDREGKAYGGEEPGGWGAKGGEHVRRCLRPPKTTVDFCGF
jgi:hypothetical protein